MHGDTGVALPSENNIKRLRHKKQFPRKGFKDAGEIYGGWTWCTVLSRLKLEQQEWGGNGIESDDSFLYSGKPLSVLKTEEL